MSGSDLASVWDAFADGVPERLAIACRGRHISWGRFSGRADRLAWHLQAEAKLDPGDRVAIALSETAEYLETFYAALKLGCVPVNVDLRRGTNAVHDILDHSDAKAVVHDRDGSKVVRTAARRIPKPWRPFTLSTGEAYERALGSAPPPTEWQPDRADTDDLILIYLGHEPTTALVWRSEDLCTALRASPHPAGHDAGVRIEPAVVLPVAPLTHTFGLFGALKALIAGVAVALVRTDPFEPRTVWDTVEREHVTVLSLVSDSSAGRLAAVLREEPGRWDVSRLRTITCGTQLGETNRDALAELLPTTEVVVPTTAARTVNDELRVVDDVTGRDVEPGSGALGVLAVGGAIPLGYYKDPERTSSHFRVIDGSRFWISGELVSVGVDRVIQSADADSALILVGGTRVSASGIEAVLHKHASVAHCIVTGVPDGPSGDRLVAMVQVVEDHYLDEAEMTAWCRSRLSAAETPGRFLFVESVDVPVGSTGNRAASRLRAIELLRRDSA